MSRVHVRPTAKTRKRRTQRRVIVLSVYVAIVSLLAWYFESQGTTTIIFVRHADTEQPLESAADVPLNETGRQRAELLADFLQDVDVIQSVDAIYVDSMKRTQQTAAPLAQRLRIEPVVADHTDVVGFMKDVLQEHKREIVLVVTEAEMIAPFVEELHGSKNIAEISADEFDKLFIVTIPWWAKVKTLQLPYSTGWKT